MNEEFLAFVWQYQYVQQEAWYTTDGQAIRVLKTGVHNRDAGPDFTGARIMIDEIEWVGNVELHVKSSDWIQHKHQTNTAYESVILHVVWENDLAIVQPSGNRLPVLELRDKVLPQVFERYQLFLKNDQTIVCAPYFKEVPAIYKSTMLERVLVERLIRKSDEVLHIFEQTQKDWEETTYRLLFKYYGGTVNAESFSRLAEIIPWRILRKELPRQLAVEALLFGIAGLLPVVPNEEEYVQHLINEFEYLSHKYQLKEKQMLVNEWKFSRMRPANFPTIRLAQLAAFLSNRSHLFAWFNEADSIEHVYQALKLPQSSYWQHHYTFAKKASTMVGSMGNAMTATIVINVLIPLRVAYSRYVDNQQVTIMEMIEWLEKIPAEDNQLLQIGKSLGMKVKNAFDSQAFLEWYKQYCTQKKCLQCSIGNHVLKSTVTT